MKALFSFLYKTLGAMHFFLYKTPFTMPYFPVNIRYCSTVKTHMVTQEPVLVSF